MTAVWGVTEDHTMHRRSAMIRIRKTFLALFTTIALSSGAASMAGSADLAMEFTDIMVDDQLFPVRTTALITESGGEGRRTAGRTARAAAVGGLIGGSSGARTGARVGVGASLLTSGTSINVPRGTLLETTLAEPFTAR